MSNTPLSMTPTGWFQVAWSEEIAVGAVHRMTYFGRDMVAWRAQSGRLAVMDAHCEHLGAHLGYGGHVRGEAIQCPFHGWQWDARGHNVAIPYEPRPNPGRRMRTYPVTERNESVYIWHDAGSNGGAQREPFFEVPDVFADFRGGCVSDYHPQMRLYRERVRLHPQYVLENGVDFAHFTFVHNTPIVPLFTRQEFDGPVSYVDFTITFDGDDGQSIDDVRSGVEAINGGLGVAVTTSWGMVDNRTISAITPVDADTCDVRFMVYIGRRPGDGSATAAAKATDFGQMVIDQFAADIDIWSHQRYQPNPALAPSEHDSFMAFRTWAAQFYPDIEAYPESDTA